MALLMKRVWDGGWVRVWVCTQLLRKECAVFGDRSMFGDIEVVEWVFLILCVFCCVFCCVHAARFYFLSMVLVGMVVRMGDPATRSVRACGTCVREQRVFTLCCAGTPTIRAV